MTWWTVALAAILSTAQATVPAERGGTVNVTASAALADHLAGHLDVTRVPAGLPSFTRDPLLDEAAQRHADDAAARGCLPDVFTHVGSDGTRAGERITDTGATVTRWAEIIGCAIDDPADMVAAWLRSKPHSLVVYGDYPRLGVGVARDDRQQIYWVAVVAE